MKPCQFDKLLDLLERLERAKISYDLEHSREDALMVRLVVPGEYWEIEFLRDGEVDVERYRSNGHIYGPETLEQLFARYSADAREATAEEHRQYVEEFYQHVDFPVGRSTVGSGTGSQPHQK
jgi:hypothetical protein